MAVQPRRLPAYAIPGLGFREQVVRHDPIVALAVAPEFGPSHEKYPRDLFNGLGQAGDRITLLLEDYRNQRGQFDKLVSIEMFEAVGLKYYDSYFSACACRETNLISRTLHAGCDMGISQKLRYYRASS